MTKKNLGGRPTKMTPDAVKKLEEAFMLGCSDLEACLVAGISRQCLYDYQDKTPGFAERKSTLKEDPTYRARLAVIKGFQDSPELALKYLERKKKDEFSLKQEIEASGSMQLTISLGHAQKVLDAAK